ncbi:hypothetical protein [Ligilactobacillus acidipiscis]|uniref:hypothetical protein n=1 Tax=Ligilactobacillus acidipiscis TaxID=89059 RepID=UPI0023F8B2CB|nr:hypothetical protein [Ligilactobacillus acidipiscis]WEV56812.1 hypothetical protein OZX66_11385 [Ligilactobacillus acidipiscis]
MLKKALTVLIPLLLLSLGTSNLVVDAKTPQHNHDYIVVYNAKHKKVTTITSKSSIDYLSDFAGDTGGSEKGIHKKLPKKAKLSYKYVFHNGKKDKIPYKLNLYVYPNVGKVKMTNIPLVSKGVWKINKKQLNKLNHPKKFTAKKASTN